MEGTICKREILAHPIVTIRSFGWKVFLRALLAGPDETFLSLLMETGTLRSGSGGLPDLIRRGIGCELRAMRIYQALAQQFPQPEAVRELFATLTRHEQGHADLLEICRGEAARTGGAVKADDSWEGALPRVEHRLNEIEASLDRVDSLDHALRIVVQIESSEINRVFSGIVATTDSDFVRALEVFRMAGQTHLAYIRQRLPELEPSLAAACQEMVY
jgi:hypothetical protein